MVRSELILRLAALNPHLYEKDCEAAIDAIIDRISEALAVGDRVELRGFASFAIKKQSARQGRNPKTGATVSVPAKAALAFKQGKGMCERLNP